MIAYLSGPVIARRGETLVVDAGGVGYAVTVSTYVYGKTIAAERVALFVHTHVREQAIELYGFLSEEELSLFELLTTVTGVGPKAAMSILSMAAPASIAASIAGGDVVAVSRAGGIGKKKAERIVLELKDKVTKLGIAPVAGAMAGGQDADAMDALVGLGYTVAEARDALAVVGDDVTDTGARIKAALRAMGARGRK